MPGHKNRSPLIFPGLTRPTLIRPVTERIVSQQFLLLT